MAHQPDFTLDDVGDALAYLDANVRDTWIQMGMAIRSEFGDEGFAVWDEWSQSGHSYKAGDARSVWRSFRRAGIGLGTLIQQAKLAGYVPKQRDPDEQKRLKKVAAARRKAVAKQLEQEQRDAEALMLNTAQLAEQLWPCFKEAESSPYLKAKQVQAFGVRVADYGIVVVYSDDPDKPHEVIWGPDEISAFFKAPRDESVKFLYIKRGTLVVPMHDIGGQLWSLQLIFEGGGKKFLKFGRKSGCFHFIGESVNAGEGMGIAEGYATAATVHQVTGMPIAVAFDAGNLMPVAQAFYEHFTKINIVIFGDDDRETEGNPGREKALAAAEAVGGVAVFPDLMEAS
jgi:putative DNA primase/helicase